MAVLAGLLHPASVGAEEKDVGWPRQVPAEPFIQVPLREYDGQSRPARAGRRGEPPGTAERPPLALPCPPRPSAPPPRARRAPGERGSAAGGGGRGPGGPRYRGGEAALCRLRGPGPGSARLGETKSGSGRVLPARKLTCAPRVRGGGREGKGGRGEPRRRPGVAAALRGVPGLGEPPCCSSR